MEASDAAIDVQSTTGQCRICLSDDSPPALIVPCRCRGSSLFVHRECLDHWRATKKDGRAFTHCGVCQFEYVIQEIPQTEEAQRAEWWRRFRFRMFVARDTIGLFLAVQVVIVLLGLFVRACDTQGQIRDMFPTEISSHEKTSYYICGFVLFFAIIGLIGLCSACVSDAPRHHDPCYGCYGCYIGDCRGCCNGGGGGGGDDAKACLVILVVMVVVLAFIGVFIGIFLASMIFQKIVQRHMRVLWLKEEVKKYRIVDFYGRENELASHADATRAHHDGGAVAMSPIMPSSGGHDRVSLLPTAPELDSSYHAGVPNKTYPDGLYSD